MGGKHTTLCVVNFSELNIIDTKVSEIDNEGWDGDSRPDNNFHSVSISHNSSRCQREELNSRADNSFYRLTFTFADGTTLSYGNDQKDAQTKFNRILSATGTAASRMTLYQTSGGDTNTIYIQSLPKPDNSGWMGNLLTRKPNVTLNDLIMPGSHDAGMYTASDCSSIVSVLAGIVMKRVVPDVEIKAEWVCTQSLDITDQLRAGSRYFDFRVYFDGQNYRLGHFGGMGGLYGPHLSDVLDQIGAFIRSPGNKESVFLKFSHTMQDSPIPTSQDVVKDTVDMVKIKIGSSLFTNTNTDTYLGGTDLSLMSGYVVATFDNEFQSHWDTLTGVFPYRDVPGAKFGPGYGLRVFDQYSNTDSLSTMSKDQTVKLQSSGGWGQDFLFLLSWTLTAQLSASLLDIQVMAAMANPWLLQTLDQVKTGTLKKPNIVYMDYIDPYLCQAVIDMN